MDVQDGLKRVPLFANFSDEARSRLAARSVLRTYVRREACSSPRASRAAAVRRRVGARAHLPHEPTGTRAGAPRRGTGPPDRRSPPLLDGGAYPASAMTEVESRLAFIPRAEFEALYRANPDVAEAVIRELGKRLRHLVHVTEMLAFRDVAARLAGFLAEYAEQHGESTPSGTEIVLDRTREELSEELGTARESVSRALKQLSEKGVIEPISGRRLAHPPRRAAAHPRPARRARELRNDAARKLVPRHPERARRVEGSAPTPASRELHLTDATTVTPLSAARAHCWSYPPTVRVPATSQPDPQPTFHPTAVTDALRRVRIPDSTRDVVSLGMVQGIDIVDDDVAITLGLHTRDPGVMRALDESIRTTIQGLGAASVKVTVVPPRPIHRGAGAGGDARSVGPSRPVR